MKIPLFTKLTAKARGRKVVRASARAMRGGEDDYYEAEPNMKLSHAFMVVLILHVVAVGGIYAFNQVNAKKNANLLANISGRIAQATGSAPAPVAAAPVAATAAPVEVPVKAEVPAPPQRLPGDADEPLPTVVSHSPGGGTTTAREVAAPAPVAAKPAAPAKPAGPVVSTSAATKGVPGTYTVAKGDNPYNIAKKFGVNYQDLLKLNNVEDPTKLQIGQVLKLPQKAD